MVGTTSFPLLTDPFPVGRRVAGNRIVHAPMSVCYGDEQGYVTSAEIAHYARRAVGGVGMVITENFAINAAGRQMPRQTMVSGEQYLPGLAALADGIREGGALALVQIVHAGRYAGPWEVYEKARRLAPSSVPFELIAGRVVTPAEMTAEEVAESIAAFGDAAALCERAGFDGVDIHAAQGFLISEFLSPLMNRRSDGWGGSFDNRSRFALKVVQEVRRRVRPDFVVGMHLMSDELIDGGWTIAEATRLAPLVAAAGVDFLFAIPATFETLRRPPNVGLYGRRAYGVADGAAFRKVVDIPVVANGGLGDPADAQAVLEQGHADAVGLARPLFVDPDWPAKVAGTQDTPIRTCPCNPPTCAQTQLTGAVCSSWPEHVVARGHLGLHD